MNLEIEGTKTVVAGMARSGLAAVELLVEHGALVCATDLRPLDQLPEAAARLSQLGIEFRIQSPEAFQGADLIVISPGVPCDLEALDDARRRGVKVIGEVELAGYFLQGDIIGITGSNGKTTTTALTGHILRESGIPVQVGGNIGTPPTSMVRSSRPGQWNVLELSSFQLEAIDTFRARIGVAINVTPDHLDRHHSFANYAKAKGRLFETQQPSDFAVLNAGDAACIEYAGITRGTTIWFSTAREVSPGASLVDGKLVFDGCPFLDVREIPLRGLHNVENTLAAAAAARLAGAGLSAIAAAVRTFPGVEHRLEYVRSVSGVDFYNDSKATNVDATRKALDAFSGRLWVILGGKDKGSDYTTLRAPLIEKARAVLLIGAAASKIASHLANSVELIQSGTLEAAIYAAYERAAPGDTVLLAPACASFDQFNSFEHRGKVFKQIAGTLEPKGSRE
jgi:UDP-N-acetylmuramoylalanine--D-glutamate ligase